ncbi:hypothetical protein [Falsiphaeobacter marinintestinus]|uniref:hypothetical protein n=1 Tax=Falsiphaeobacter marinintestinus TaxID=1492905 RepID=UPI0011B79A33|nr:hypothetical protein [Phaeobacter marinintestinus]
MKISKVLAVVGVVGCISASAVSAQEFVKYGEAQGWTVFSEPSKKTCVAEIERDGLLVQMGVLKDSLGYIGVFTKEDDANLGETGNDLIIDLDDKTYHGPESVMHKNSQGYSGAVITASNPEFIADIENKNTIKVVDTERVFTMSLAGTKAAIAMARECIAAQ